MKSMNLVIGMFLLFAGCATRQAPEPGAAPTLEAKPEPARSMAAWEVEWEKTLQAARKEGRVNFYTTYGGNWRQAFSEAMAKKYSINMEFTLGTTSESVARLIREQQNKLYLADVVSLSSGYKEISHREGILQPLDKMLILPEVGDPKAWYRGQLTWIDPVEKTILAWRETVTPPIVINTDLVKPGELKSWNDLLDPKWKGRILMQDPAEGGGGQVAMAMLAYKIKNWDFIQAFLKQEPTLLRDKRLTTEWVARGKYPVVVGPRKETVFEFMQLGAPLKYITPLEGTHASVGDGSIGLLKSSPHPNAAKIFINFLFSKEGQTLSSKMSGQLSLRVDVPTDHLDPATVHQPGVEYISTADKGYMEKEVELREEVRKIFEAYLKKK